MLKQCLKLMAATTAVDGLTHSQGEATAAVLEVATKLGAIADRIDKYIDDKKREAADRDLDEEVSRRVTDELDRRERAKRSPRAP